MYLRIIFSNITPFKTITPLTVIFKLKCLLSGASFLAQKSEITIRDRLSARLSASADPL